MSISQHKDLSEPEHNPNPQSLLSYVRSTLGQLWNTVAPGHRAWRGAAWALLISIVIITVQYVMLLGKSPATILIGFFVGLVVVLLFLLLGRLLSSIITPLGSFPEQYGVVLVAALPLMILALLERPGAGAILAIYLTTSVSLVGAGIAVWQGDRGRQLIPTQHTIWVGGFLLGIALLLVLVLWAFFFPSNTYQVPEAALIQHIAPLDMSDPSESGDFSVQTLTYGSGTDFRSAYGSEAELITQPVDGSRFLTGWTGIPGWYRTRYWGFDASEMPLNGMVWYPDGDGKFPLILIVHGNHQMDEFSEPGYAYLGELLASRGYIVVSVDENFLNQGPQDILLLGSIQRESAARAWLLLEHLRVWHEWNNEQTNPFYQKVNTDEIALIGHSMGGEAIALAAAFNTMAYFPNDTRVQFHYGYKIRSLIALAPADSIYSLRDENVHLEDINYLVLQGSADADVSSFVGLGQYHRLSLSDETDTFKTALYIFGANHGQFNTVWGMDGNWHNRLVRNWRAIMPAEDQRQIAKVFISAFLETTLNGVSAYRPLFQNPQLARQWLPDSYIIPQYQDATINYLATYEEDLDPGTGVSNDIVISTQDLSTWIEQPVLMMNGQSYTHAVFVGWDAGVSEDVSPTYQLTVLGNIADVNNSSLLVFDLASSDPNPTDNQTPINLAIELLDSNGDTAQVSLSDFAVVLPMLSYQQYKAPIPRIDDIAEIVFNRVEIPINAFVTQNSNFDPNTLSGILFKFDATRSMNLVLDNIGIQ